MNQTKQAKEGVKYMHVYPPKDCSSSFNKSYRPMFLFSVGMFLAGIAIAALVIYLGKNIIKF